jgi:hypothetical protein
MSRQNVSSTHKVPHLCNSTLQHKQTQVVSSIPSDKVHHASQIGTFHLLKSTLVYDCQRIGNILNEDNVS